MRSCDQQVFVFMLKPLWSFMNYITRVKFHILLFTTFPTLQLQFSIAEKIPVYPPSSRKVARPSQTSLKRSNSNLVPRVFLRHTLITKPNEHPVSPWYTSMKCAQNLGAFGSHYGFHSWLGNAKLQKMAVALALILQKMEGEIENKHFEDLI